LPAAQAFAAIVAAALVQAGTNGVAMAGSRDPEYLHQLRVGLRRLRSALRAFAPILERTRPVKRALRRLSPALGVARDWDVMVKNAPAYGVPAQLVHAARARRNAARLAALKLLDSAHFRRLLFRSLRWLESKPWVATDMTLAAFAPGRLEKLHASVLRRPELASAASRHRLRVRIKRLRYAAEFFAPAFPAQAVGAYLRPLRVLQELLGELNDIAVARRLLRELGAAPAPGLARRKRQLIGRLSRAWARFERQKPYWRPPA
jgi:CHAD domain-containing protein